MTTSQICSKTGSYLLLFLSLFYSANSMGEDQTGVYVDETDLRLPTDNVYATRSGIGDVDGDGYVDIVVPNGAFTGSAVPLHDFLLQINDGTGRFENEAATRLPITAFGTQYAAGAILGDVDGDNDLDIFVANGTSRILATTPDDWQNRLWINNGNGVFFDQTTSRLPVASNSSFHAAIADIDADGDPDIVVGNVGRGGMGDQNRVLINDGSGTFVDDTLARLPLLHDITLAVTLNDLDNDGDFDLVVANAGYGSSKIMVNDGTGVFSDQSATRLLPNSPSMANDVRVADLDGDNDVDIMFSSHLVSPYVYINNGSGVFTDESASRVPAYTGALSLVLADVDRDRDFDSFISVPSQETALIENDGSGFFTDITDTNLPIPTNDTIRFPVCADVDNDGDPDFYLAVTYNDLTDQQDRLLINLGDPVERIIALMETTEDFNLPRGAERPLLNKLNMALQKLTNATSGDDTLAVRRLNDYVSLVEVKAGSQISPEQATTLIELAEDIIDRLSNPAECV